MSEHATCEAAGFNHDKTFLISVKDIYGKPFSELTAPNGYEYTGEFRCLQPGDIWQGSNNPSIWDGPATINGISPRLILRKKKRIRVIYEPTGEHRAVRSGEYYKGYDGAFLQCSGTYLSPFAADVYTRREEEY